MKSVDATQRWLPNKFNYWHSIDRTILNPWSLVVPVIPRWSLHHQFLMVLTTPRYRAPFGAFSFLISPSFFHNKSRGERILIFGFKVNAVEPDYIKPIYIELPFICNCFWNDTFTMRMLISNENTSVNWSIECQMPHPPPQVGFPKGWKFRWHTPHSCSAWPLMGSGWLFPLRHLLLPIVTAPSCHVRQAVDTLLAKKGSRPDRHTFFPFVSFALGGPFRKGSCVGKR